MDELARRLGVSDKPKPVLVIFSHGMAGHLAAVTISERVLDDKSLGRAMGRLLCMWLTEQKLRKHIAAGKERLQEYLGRVLRPLSDPYLLGPWTHVGLTEDQADAYAEYGYLAHDALHVTGKMGKRDRNLIVINDEHHVCLTHQQFELLLQLIVALKNDDQGWIHRKNLEKTVESSLPQAFKRLRDGLRVVVREPDRLIESSHTGAHRLSTHPDFVTYDRKRLMNCENATVTNLAKQLPVRRLPTIG